MKAAGSPKGLEVTADGTGVMSRAGPMGGGSISGADAPSVTAVFQPRGLSMLLN